MDAIPSVKHLLVDLDGTLLESHDFPLRIDFTAEALKSLRVHGGLMKAVRALRALSRELDTPSKDLTNDKRAARVFARSMGIPEGEAEKVIRESVSAVFPKMQRYFYPVPGAKDFLVWAKGSFPMILATNPVWAEDNVKLRLKWADVDPSWFKSITHAARMHACKPSPEYYAEVLEQEGLDPKDCLLVGDDLKKDLPATKVGIRVFIVSAKSAFKHLQSARKDTPAYSGTYAKLQAMLAAGLKSSP